MGGVSGLAVAIEEATGVVMVLDVDRRVPWYVAGPGSAGPGSIVNEERMQGRILKFDSRCLERRHWKKNRRLKSRVFLILPTLLL
jgi:hypothetical protein